MILILYEFHMYYRSNSSTDGPRLQSIHDFSSVSVMKDGGEVRKPGNDSGCDGQ